MGADEGSKQEADSDLVDILLVEDNPLDAKALFNAAQKLEMAGRIHAVRSGQGALDLLRRVPAPRTEQASDGPPPDFRPGLILLDLNLPGKTGHDVLAEIRADALLRSLPVVILTTSDDHSDIETAYTLGANAYIKKPMGLDGWLDVISTINDFWLSVATLPK